MLKRVSSEHSANPMNRCGDEPGGQEMNRVVLNWMEMAQVEMNRLGWRGARWVGDEPSGVDGNQEGRTPEHQDGLTHDVMT
ncbi:unnamed protein product [Arctogadus glacialis]